MADEFRKKGGCRDPEGDLPWAKAATVVVRDCKLSVSARLLYVILRSYDGVSGHCWVGRKRLAQVMRCSERQISNLNRELVAAGLVDRQTRGRRTAMTFMKSVEDSSVYDAGESDGKEGPDMSDEQLKFEIDVNRKVRVKNGERKQSDAWKLVVYYAKKTRKELTDLERGKYLRQAKLVLKDVSLDDAVKCIDWMMTNEWWSTHQWSLSAVGGEGVRQFRKAKNKMARPPGGASEKPVKKAVDDRPGRFDP